MFRCQSQIITFLIKYFNNKNATGMNLFIFLLRLHKKFLILQSHKLINNKNKIIDTCVRNSPILRWSSCTCCWCKSNQNRCQNVSGVKIPTQKLSFDRCCCYFTKRDQDRINKVIIWFIIKWLKNCILVQMVEKCKVR